MLRFILLTFSVLILLTPGVVTAEAVDILPVLDEEISITDWHVIGPFLSGPREPLANPLESAFHPLDSSGIPNLNARYPSTLETGRDVKWTEIGTDENGSLNVAFENVDWDKINDEWGMSGIYYTGAAYTTFQSSRKCRALANAHSIGSFILNGVRYSGDPYGHGLIKAPVILEEGENHVMFFFGGFGGTKSVKFDLEPPPSELMILDRDILVPDVVTGEPVSGYVGIPVLNTTNAWVALEEITIRFGNDEVTIWDHHTIPPLCVVNIPQGFTIQPSEPFNAEDESVEVKISVKHELGVTEAVTRARIRKPDDSRIITFLSNIDNSAQKLAVRYPIDYDPDTEYALILTLHGAGVECQGLVDAYQSKDWAFVVAPTNRRSYGFDWQDWGRLDAGEVLAYCNNNFNIDSNRTYLTGHSMGGHGTWHVGTTHADAFAAIAPSAGWASFPLYIPWFLRNDELFADPDLKRIIDACHSPDRTELLLENLRNTPVLAIHGADDDNVPPTHARLLTGMLDRMGYQAAYWEEPGQGHWWDASPDVPGADCVDHDRIIDFFKNNVRDPMPKHVSFVTYDLANSNGSFWVRVEEEIKPMGRIAVDAEFIPGKNVVCTTHNVKHLKMDFTPVTPDRYPKIIEIDGQMLDVVSNGPFEHPGGDTAAIHLNLKDGRWILGEPPDPGITKTHDFRGPIKRAYYNPFLIIIGTVGTEEENALNLEIARNLAQRWWYRANGYVKIMKDTEVDSFDTSLNNLILIGGPESNYVSRIVAPNMPIKMDEGGVWLGDEFIPGEDLAVKFVYPKRYSQGLILCNWGTSLEGTRLAGGLTCLYSGSGLPDFLIYDREVKLKGYAGVRAMGFFDNGWNLDPDLYYLTRN